MSRHEHLPFGVEIETIRGGYIKLVDIMGNDARIASTARISTGSEPDPERDRRLIRYLMRQDPPHLSPLEFCEIQLEIKAPLYVWAQWVRHRTASINQRSMRAQDAPERPEDAFYQAETWRLQTTENKMGSAGALTPTGQGIASGYECSIQEIALDTYHALRIIGADDQGVSREQARAVLPQSAWTVANWKIDLRNLLGFLTQRLHPHAQAEIRIYADAIAEIVKAWVPLVWEAFEDYHRHSRRLSRLELEALRRVLRGAEPLEATKGLGMAKNAQGTSEQGAFLAWMDGITPEAQPVPKGEGLPVLPFLVKYFNLPPCAWVREALEERTQEGVRKYGEPLRASNGRDPVVDAEEEALDLLQYVGQVLIENAYKDARGEAKPHNLERIKRIHRMIGDLLTDA